MSSGTAITVENLAKCYQIYDKPHQRLMQMLWRGHRQYYHEFWALNNVSFTVAKGETVGIIGKNGSGKSTLLQLICGTLNPTAGRIVTNGRVAALLELGSGFNPEFTGRENVFLNAAILGLTHEEIKARFDDIAAFADIGQFMDQPVKMYSSGMYVRLAFAVVINVDPDILIVDEALSVGDERFVRKCFARIQAIRESGATILFVSHSGGTIIELCERALLLDGGERLLTGTPKTVYGYYQRLLYAEGHKSLVIREEIRELDRKTASSPSDAVEDIKGQETARHERAAEALGSEALYTAATSGLEELFDPNLKPKSTISYESRGALINEPKITTLDGRLVNHLLRGRWYKYSYQVQFFQDAQYVRFGMMIRTKTGLELGGAATAPTNRDGLEKAFAGSLYQVEFEFFCGLGEGTYFMNAGANGDCDGEENYLHRLLDVLMFKVRPDSPKTMTGMIDFRCQPKYQLIAS